MKAFWVLLASLLISAFASGCGSESGSFVSGAAQGHSVMLGWTAPTGNTDGSPLTNLAGYNVYYGTASRIYGPKINVGNVTRFTVHGLAPGEYYFAVTAYRTDAVESTYSNEAAATIPGAHEIPLGWELRIKVPRGGTKILR